MLVTLENQVFPVLGVGHTDFFKKKIPTRVKFVHILSSLFCSGGKTYLQSLGFLCFQRDGMHFCLYKFGEETTLHLGKRRGG